MFTNPFVKFLLIVALFSQLILQQSCKKEESQTEPLYLTVSLPQAVRQNDSYYKLNYLERSVELHFSRPIDNSTIKGNIFFADKGGSLEKMYEIIFSGSKVIIVFQQGFILKSGWKYLITIKTGLKSISGIALKSDTEIELRTTTSLGLENDTVPRNSIVCISDIHLGDQRSFDLKYCWFTKNSAALDSLLDMVIKSPQVRQLVILGDFFDEWAVPYRIAPFDSQAGIRNSRDYFMSVANSDVNRDIIGKFRTIATGGFVKLIYVPGNHDMLLTREILQEIIPGIIWQGDLPGLGYYSPVNEIIMEHGHRYDFFNCPQPLSNPGHTLPPGYFVSRLDAEGLMEHGPSLMKSTTGETSHVAFLTAWIAAITYLQIQYSLTVAYDSTNIRMTGIDGYTASLSYHGVRNMYAANIEDNWLATQTGNGVPVSMPVVMAILNGNLDLFLTATYEYMLSAAPKRYKIVAFGHTHNPMLKVFPAGIHCGGIYANTGSWVNAELSGKPVRTFLVIKPGEWTGSDLDVVSLYQYNLNSGSGTPNPGFIPVLISEESIGR
jgi:UDP-2,3-diacylglucosamine pyrophosphatase LpxH